MEFNLVNNTLSFTLDALDYADFLKQSDNILNVFKILTYSRLLDNFQLLGSQVFCYWRNTDKRIGIYYDFFNTQGRWYNIF